MAYQTSKILQKHSTARSIGRLMDADFFGVMFSISRLYDSRVGPVARLATRRKGPTDLRETSRGLPSML